MRLADYVAQAVAAAGCRDVFMVTGGFALHLNDAFARSPELAVTCFHHEQAAAMAADGYFRVAGVPAVVNVTAGPGATNALTGVLGAWDDSCAMVVVSGQPKRDVLTPSTGLALRQFGEQELDIAAMVRGITKHAVQVLDPADIRFELERALHLAVHGRPGPVWVDIPLDVQSADVDPLRLRAYDPAADPAAASPASDPSAAAADVAGRLALAERPVVLVGPDLHSAGAAAEVRALAGRLEVPFVAAINGVDLLGHDHPRLVGRVGLIGDRAGNLAVQNADLVIVVGTRLPIGMTGYDGPAWAPRATVVMVELDPAEMQKPTLHVEVPVHCDPGAFVRALLATPLAEPTPEQVAWLAWCEGRRAAYPVIRPEWRSRQRPINPYLLFTAVFDHLDDTTIAVTGNAWAGNGAYQAGTVRAGQRCFASIGCGSMGHDLPAAIGCALGAPGRTIACIPGDGSLQMNLQELQTVVHHQLPVKLFVLANGGYASIRQSQTRFYPDNLVGCAPQNGISFPDLAKLAPAYGLPFRRVESYAALGPAVAWAAAHEGPVMVEVVVDAAQEYEPKSATRQLEDGSFVSSPLEDMAPFLSREEVEENTAPARGALRRAGVTAGRE